MILVPFSYDTSFVTPLIEEPLQSVVSPRQKRRGSRCGQKT